MSRPSHVSITARGLTVAAGPRILLSRVDLTASPGTRLGLVGPNGSGKTTLLRSLAGHHRPDTGTVRVTPGDATVGYLPQETRPRADETVGDLVARRTGVAAAARDLERATAELATAGETEGTGAADRYAAALDRWLGLGGADLDARAEAVLAEVGLPAGLLRRPTTDLSGGQAARVQLAALLSARFDVFLLDEPTNNLDLDGLERLERFVVGLPGPVVLVSHDRAFLEQTVTAVAEVDDRNRASAPPTLSRYEGGWQSYLDERDVTHRHARAAFREYADKRDALAERSRRQREWSSKGTRAARRSGERDKHIRHRHSQGAQRMAARARKVDDESERLDPVDKPWEGWDLRLTIADAGPGGEEVAGLTDAVVELPGADGGTGFRLGPVTLQVGRGERIALVGPNGSGKTTLLRALSGELPLDAGRRRIGPGVVVGEIGQRRDTFAEAPTLLDGFTRRTGLDRPAEARALLAKFGLTAEHVGRSPDSLSPGERTRADLAVLQARGVNLLVLDEPTNHLDLPAIRQLEEAVGSFSGTLVLVSHDRRLLDAVACDRAIGVVDGTIRERR